jgi:glutaminase
LCVNARTDVTDNSDVDNQQVLWAAAEGSLDELIRLNVAGQNLTAGDYDGRTPLMLAASNGHIECVKYILVQARKQLKPIDLKKYVFATDAFGGTALTDAAREGHEDCLKELQTD